MTTTPDILIRILAAAGITVGLVIVGPTPVAFAGFDTSICSVAPEIAGPYCGAIGDDNGDGFIMEDESGWDCATMGNLICGREMNR